MNLPVFSATEARGFAELFQRSQEAAAPAPVFFLRFKANGQYLCAESPFVLKSGDTFGGPWSSVDDSKDATPFATRAAAGRKAKALGITSEHWEIV